MDKNIETLHIQYGSASSEQMLHHPCFHFQMPDCSGVIAYRIEDNCVIVIGDPICPANEIAKLASAFHAYCKDQNLLVVYMIISETFAKWLHNHDVAVSMEVCEEMVFDPSIDPCLSNKKLRQKVRKARKYGLTVHEYVPHNPAIEEELLNIAKAWATEIKGPHIYLGPLDLFKSRVGRRWFYVKEGEKITAMAMLSKIQAHQGWLLKFFITAPGAFRPTSEYFMASLLETLRKENCRFLTKGAIAKTSLGTIYGMRAFSRMFVRSTYKLISIIFRFQKRREYWTKYNPSLLPTYLLFCAPRIKFHGLKTLMKVLRMD